jgi:hypothetical protein
MGELTAAHYLSAASDAVNASFWKRKRDIARFVAGALDGIHC